MATVKRKSSKSRSRGPAQKRGSTAWRFASAFRRLWTTPLIKTGLMAGMALLLPTLLWWAGYPQRFGNFVSQSIIAATGKVGLSLSEVLVEGRHHTPLDKILRVVNARRGHPLLAYDPYQIKKQLEEIAWVRQATVKRELPGLLLIHITERQPVALWQHQQRYYLVDEHGVIISSDQLQAFGNLPIIVGGDAPVHAPPILRLLEKFPEIRQRLTALVRVGGRRWDMHLDKTVQIKLPETKVEEALGRLALLIEQKKINASEVTVVDLRIAGQIAMRLSPTAAMRLKDKGKET